MNSTQSDYRKISCGIPQGSILGPLLFLLYINGPPNVSNKLSFSLFADDTTITFSGSSLKICLKTTQTKLVHAFEWFIANKPMINFTKMYYILFDNSYVTKDVPVLICNYALIRVENTKFVGI